MDEIGLIVTRLEKGFVRFAPVGGVDLGALPAQEVTVHGRSDLPGLIASRPPPRSLPGGAGEAFCSG